MADNPNDQEDPEDAAYEALLAMSDLLDRLETEVKLALGTNLDTDDQRDSEGKSLDFAGAKAVVEEKIALMDREDETVTMPSPQTVAKVAAMVERVEREIAAGLRADAAIKLAFDVAKLAGELAA